MSFLEKVYDCTEWTARNLYKGTSWTLKQIGKGLSHVPKKVKGGAVCAALAGSLVLGYVNHKNETDIGALCENYCTEARQETRGKLTGQEIVDYAKQYVGTPYGRSTSACRPGKCNMQCAAFVGSVFKYAAKDKGVNIRTPRGDGIDKCENIWEVKKNKFGELEMLKPGDIFSSTSNSRYGHAGIYVGRGDISQRVGNSRVYKKFTPNPNGKHVIIHSTSPVVGYSKLEEIMRNEDMTFCRHEALCTDEDEVCNQWD